MNYGCGVVYVHIDEQVYLIIIIIKLSNYFWCWNIFIKTSHTKAGSHLLCNVNMNIRCRQISLKTKMIIIEKYSCYASSNVVVIAKINSKIGKFIYKNGKTNSPFWISHRNTSVVIIRCVVLSNVVVLPSFRKKEVRLRRTLTFVLTMTSSTSYKHSQLRCCT